MSKKFRIVPLMLLTVFIFQYSQSFGQSVYFTGLGRALFSIDRMEDGIKPDSRQRASSGYTLFDLGFNMENQGLFRAGAIIRLRNEFGGFFGDGTSLDIRQVQAEGIIGKKVKWEIGDIYMSQTPYTLWNFDEIYHDYESDLFAIRRSVVNYENFFIDNNWRIQGVNTKTALNFSKGIKSLELQAYGGRLAASDLISVPDRFLYGGRAGIVQSKFFRIGGNLTAISDIAGTIEEAQVAYNNVVATTDFRLTYDKGGKFKYELLGESGISNLALTQASTDTSIRFGDYFYDVGVNVTYKPLNLGLVAKYRDVGPDFNSPAAQTRKIHDVNAVGLTAFPNYNDLSTVRPMSLFDRFTQEEGLYNTSISTILLPFLPQYNNIEPYGDATPNRRGFSADMVYSDSAGIIKGTLGTDLLSEIHAEGEAVNRSLRSFIGLNGGVILNVHKILGFDKDLSLKAGGRYEDTYRETNRVDLRSFLVDIGADVEVINKLHLLGGAKMLTANGNEFVSVRNEYNDITSFNNFFVDVSEKVYSVGLRYDFGSTIYFSPQFMLADYQDRADEGNNFRLAQWFFLFNMRF